MKNEVNRLLELVEDGASQIEIAREFPERTWQAIRSRLRRERGTGRLKELSTKIKYAETYSDYLERVGENSVKHMSSGNHSPGVCRPE